MSNHRFLIAFLMADPGRLSLTDLNNPFFDPKSCFRWTHIMASSRFDAGCQVDVMAERMPIYEAFIARI
jgi:hypothetical protein